MGFFTSEPQQELLDVVFLMLSVFPSLPSPYQPNLWPSQKASLNAVLAQLCGGLSLSPSDIHSSWCGPAMPGVSPSSVLQAPEGPAWLPAWMRRQLFGLARKQAWSPAGRRKPWGPVQQRASQSLNSQSCLCSQRLTASPLSNQNFFFCFMYLIILLFRAAPGHMEVPRLGVEAEL